MARDTWLDSSNGWPAKGEGKVGATATSAPAETWLADAPGSSRPTCPEGDSEAGDATVLRLPSRLARQWRIVRELATRGAEADLVLVADADSARRVAKIYRRGIEAKTEVLQRVGGASFEHVVRLYEHGRSDGRCYELLEYAEPGSLEDLLRREGLRLPEPRVREILVELAGAVDHLHRHDVVHRDLKPSNVLVRSLNPLDLVLTDFGIASLLDASRRYTSGSRTIAYAAPETGAGEVSRAADWWSLGIMLIEMLTGRHPFAGPSAAEFLDDRIIMSRLAQLPTDQLVEGVSEPWRTLCRGLLRREAKNRWGGKEVERWLQADPTLRVVPETAPAADLGQPYPFLGKQLTTLVEIARAFAADWAEARKDLERGHLVNWVDRQTRDTTLHRNLVDLDHDYEDLDVRLFLVLLRLDKDATPSFRGNSLDPEGLRRLADEALSGDQRAQETLTLLHDLGILSLAAAKTGIESYRQLHEQWAVLYKDYRSACEAATRAGAPAVATAGSHGRARAAMLAASLPGGDAAVAKMRNIARAAIKPGTNECDWFRALGDPREAPASRAYLMALVADPAWREAEQKRNAREEEERQRRAAYNARRQAERADIIKKGIIASLIGVVIIAIFIPIYLNMKEKRRITSIANKIDLAWDIAQNGRPSLVAQSSFGSKGFNKKFIIFIEYSNAIPGKDVISAKIYNQERVANFLFGSMDRTCSDWIIPTASGTYNCTFNSLPDGNYYVQVYVDSVKVREENFFYCSTCTMVPIYN